MSRAEIRRRNFGSLGAIVGVAAITVQIHFAAGRGDLAVGVIAICAYALIELFRRAWIGQASAEVDPAEIERQRRAVGALWIWFLGPLTLSFASLLLVVPVGWHTAPFFLLAAVWVALVNNSRRPGGRWPGHWSR